MALTTYEQVLAWARAIKQKVLAREMQPYRYDATVGIQKLKFDLRLSEAESKPSRGGSTAAQLAATRPTWRRRRSLPIQTSG